MSPAEILAAHGIQRAPEVVELARVGRLDLAAACVLLEKESGGGRNVWGHDNVPTGDAYDKGGVVTRDDYLAYRTAIRAGRAGRQGVGPCQLTFGPYQDQADAVGGCWDWRANCLTGFRVLAMLIRVSGVEDGFRAYNGSGPAADKYAADAMRRLAKWRGWLAAPVPQEDDDVAHDWTVTTGPRLTDDDIARIAQAVWAQLVANTFGTAVTALQVVNGIERRVADLQVDVAALKDRLGG